MMADGCNVQSDSHLEDKRVVEKENGSRKAMQERDQTSLLVQMLKEELPDGTEVVASKIAEEAETPFMKETIQKKVALTQSKVLSEEEVIELYNSLKLPDGRHRRQL